MDEVKKSIKLREEIQRRALCISKSMQDVNARIYAMEVKREEQEKKDTCVSFLDIDCDALRLCVSHLDDWRSAISLSQVVGSTQGCM